MHWIGQLHLCLTPPLANVGKRFHYQSLIRDLNQFNSDHDRDILPFSDPSAVVLEPIKLWRDSGCCSPKAPAQLLFTSRGILEPRTYTTVELGQV